MNGCFVLYPFELMKTLTKRINVGVSTDNSFGCELAEDVVCMEDIPPYDVSLRDGWAISTTEGNHTLVGEPVKNGEQPALLQKNGSGLIPLLLLHCHHWKQWPVSVSPFSPPFFFGVLLFYSITIPTQKQM